MYFKRIDIHGFKSFAEPVSIEFDRGITCVVGPNGSGKSNISDAIRWVLGEQSPKMLRGSRMDDVIFSGTATRKSRGMAEVTLVIDNSNKMLPIEYSEVAITRRMYRSGESEYAINNHQCRMKDIRDLLTDTGIGVDGYSLIGQGKISEIISNKKESIRDIFEETAGIVGYRNKKAEAQRKLDATNNNILRVNDIFRELEERLFVLEDESKRAEEYLGLKDRYRELEVGLILRQIDELGEKIKVFSNDSKGLEDNIEKYQSEKEELEKYIVESDEKSLYLEELVSNYTVEANKLSDEAKEKIAENNVAREKLRGISNNTLRIKREIKEFNEEIEKNTFELNDIIENLKSDKLKKESKEKELLNIENTLNQENKENIVLKDEYRKLVSSKNEISNKLTLTTSKIEFLKTQIDRVNSSNDEVTSEGDISELEIKLDSKLKESRDLAEDINGINQIISNYETNIRDIDEECRNIDQNIQSYILKENRISARHKALTDLEEAYEGYNYPVKFLMKQKIKGICGTVADIISLAKDYTLAIETALGSSLQNIIVENENDAKIAIEKLKQNKAGRATFLPISKVRGRDYSDKKENLNIKGLIGFCNEKVVCEDKYRDIVSYLLGNTLLFDTLDNAISGSKKISRYRIVTLSGEVINQSGAMTGGTFKNNTLNLLGRKEEVSSLVKELEDCKKIKEIEIDRLEEKRLKRENFLREKLDLEAKLSNLKKESEINKIDIETLKSELSYIQREKLKLEEKLIRALEEKDNLNKNLNENVENRNSLNLELEQVDSNLEIVENKVKQSDIDLEEIKENLLNSRLDLNVLIQNEESSQRMVTYIENKINELHLSIENREGQLANLDIDKSITEEKIELRSKESAELKIKKDTLETKLIQARNNLREDKEELSSMRRRLDELNFNLSRIQGQKYEIDLKLAKQEAQGDGLKERLWEEFEISYAEALAIKPLDISISSATKENREIKAKIKSLGDINIGSIKEFKEVKERVEFLDVQRSDILASAKELETIIADMDKVIKKRFKDSFNSISEHFEQVFKEFFKGGQAKIDIDNIEDPLNSSISITAQPPGKQLKNINLLSGGEKTMTAIALMFAVLKTKPTPCCILDEVEAALDDNNIHIFANYLRNFRDIQFTLITHQKTTMEHSDVMYGVTMPERGISKIFSLKMGEEF